MTPDAQRQAEESFWVQRLARGAGSCVSWSSGPGQTLEGFWRDVFSTTRPGARMLELGCGSGDVSIFAAEAGRQLRIVASDIHERADLIRQHPAVSYLGRAYAEALPADPASFDMVVSNFAFEYTPDRGTAVAELDRVLRPGGGAALVLHSSDSTVTVVSRDLLEVNDQLVRAEVPDRLTRAAAMRSDHLSRRKLLKDILKLRGALPERPSGLSASFYFALAERLLQADPNGRKEVEALNVTVDSLVGMSRAQIKAALDGPALAELQRQFAARGMRVQVSEISGTYAPGAVQKIGWLLFLTKPGAGAPATAG